MEYPLIIGGSEQGRVRAERDGLYTVFEAELHNVQEGIYRIWLHGGGKSAYLGLMQPWSGGMYLRKKLSRHDMRLFPEPIDYASDMSRQAEPEPAAPGPSCPWPPPEPEEEGLLWLRRTDGSLVSHDGLSGLIALPASLRGPSPGAVLKKIEGREYIIFRY